MDDECKSLCTPDDPDKYSDTLVKLLRKAYNRGLPKAIIRQFLYRAASNFRRLISHFGEDAVTAMKAELEEVHEDLADSNQPEMRDFAVMNAMVMRAANPPSFRTKNPQPGLAMNFLRQAEHDVAAAQNDNIGRERSGQWACFKLHQVNVSAVFEYYEG